MVLDASICTSKTRTEYQYESTNESVQHKSTITCIAHMLKVVVVPSQTDPKESYACARPGACVFFLLGGRRILIE